MDIEEILTKHLKNIAIPRDPLINPLGYRTVQQYIYSEMCQYGNTTKQTFKQLAFEGTNLILKFPGECPQLAPIIIGAHYDGVPNTNGADDNGTGAAALLILAQHLSNHPPKRPIWLVAFDLEEWGMKGSFALASSLYDQKQNLHFMISLEMLGFTSDTQNYPLPEMANIYGTKGDFLALVSNNAMSSITDSIRSIFLSHVPTQVLTLSPREYSLPGVSLSDHSPFWEFGYNGMMITDTAFMRNPNYHQVSDTIDSLDFNFFVSVILGLIDLVSTLE